MTEKWIIKDGEIIHTATNITFDSFIDIVVVLNGQSKNITQLYDKNKELKYENEYLKRVMQSVYDSLILNVDVFSDEAEKHSLMAYKEMHDLDDKDIYHMVRATKQVIKMLENVHNE